MMTFEKHGLTLDRSFVLNELCDRVGTQDLGTSISNITAYLETRVILLRNIKVCGFRSQFETFVMADDMSRT